MRLRTAAFLVACRGHRRECSWRKEERRGKREEQKGRAKKKEERKAGRRREGKMWWGRRDGCGAEQRKKVGRAAEAEGLLPAAPVPGVSPCPPTFLRASPSSAVQPR